MLILFVFTAAYAVIRVFSMYLIMYSIGLCDLSRSPFLYSKLGPSLI